jgi:uncharacterized membrane protein
MRRFILICSTLVVLATLGCNNSTNQNDGKTTDSLNLAKDVVEKGSASLAGDLLNINFFGTEPFWNLKFKEDFAEYSSPMKDGVTKVYYKKDDKDASKPKLKDAVNKVSENEVNIKGVMDGVNLSISIKKGSCNDGMSAETNPYSISFSMEKGESFSGCGKK